MYRAEDRRLRRQATLRVLPTGLTGNVEPPLTFMREAREEVVVGPTNIGTIDEAGGADGVVFIATELMRRGNLGARRSDALRAREGVGGRRAAPRSA